MKKVLKVRFDGKRVFFENVQEAVDFLEAMEIPVNDQEITETEMSEEEFNNLKEFEQ